MKTRLHVYQDKALNVPSALNTYRIVFGKILKGQLCFLGNVSGFRHKDAPFVLLLLFLFLRSFRQNFNVFKYLFLESRNIQIENCAPIQCSVWPRKEGKFFKKL